MTLPPRPRKKLKLTTYQCPRCKDFVYSRAHHDMRSCTCGGIAVDGGFEYCRIMFKDEVGEPKMFIKYLDVTKDQLYRDWNTQINKWGILKGK